MCITRPVGLGLFGALLLAGGCGRGHVAAPAANPPAAARAAWVARLKAQPFPLIDYHVHLKGGLTMDAVVAKCRAQDIGCGVAPNCGLGFPITNDVTLVAYVERLRSQPVFLGMQAEGREWVKLFSRAAVARCDYVFTDAMTFTDNAGRRTRLWIKEEVAEIEPQAFMDLYLKRILGVLNNEPVDIYVNPTFLPAYLAGRYDELWTEARMRQVIEAAVRHGIAIEINDRYRLPSKAFIRLAKDRGVKFAFGSNNDGQQFADFKYAREVIRDCGLQPGDMFWPRSAR